MVRVVSCRYLRISCSEDDHPLFRRYYARSNRERGVKLLRCFPHCCPEHVQRCYCGSSIHVLITFTSEISVFSQGNLVVCARFEPSRMVPLWPSNLANTPAFDGVDEENQRKLQPGEVVSLPTSLLTANKHQPQQTAWIRADREGDGKQRYQNAVLFVLNNHRFPKWLYSYDSSITRTQREMTHHLVVYVCQRLGTSSEPGEIDATILARHESPGFSMISYRRSGKNGSDAGCDLPAIDMASSTEFAAVAIDSEDMETDAVGQSVLWNAHELEAKRQHCPIPYHKQQQLQQMMMRHKVFQRPGYAVSYLESQGATYQPLQQGCSIQEKGKLLLILWRFFQSVSLSDLGICPDTVSAHIRSYWLQSAACLRAPPRNLMKRLTSVVESFFGEMFATVPSVSSKRTPANSTDNMARTARASTITVHLFLRALSSDPIQHHLITACTVRDDMIGKTHLQDQFELLVSDLYDTFGDLLREIYPPGNQDSSLPVLVDDVLSLMCTQESSSELRAEVMTLLVDQQAVNSIPDALNDAFQTFTALVRESMIASALRHKQCCMMRSQGDGLLWNQRWLLEPGSVHVIDTSLPEMGLADLAQVTIELGWIDVAVVDDGSSLSVQSPISLLGEMTRVPMCLVLDGKLRVFRVLPSGLPSMIQTAGGWSVGDYTAILSEDKRSLTVDLFSFVEETHDDARPVGSLSNVTIRLRRISLVIRVEEEVTSSEAIGSADPNDIFAYVHGSVYESTYSPSTSEQMAGLKLSGKQTSDRAATWSGVQWAPLCEVEAGYIALPWVGFV